MRKFEILIFGFNGVWCIEDENFNHNKAKKSDFKITSDTEIFIDNDKVVKICDVSAPTDEYIKKLQEVEKDEICEFIHERETQMVFVKITGTFTEAVEYIKEVFEDFCYE